MKTCTCMSSGSIYMSVLARSPSQVQHVQVSCKANRLQSNCNPRQCQLTVLSSEYTHQ
eukprot:jgi/Botrbrau1/14977/Bobra.0018s0077.1